MEIPLVDLRAELAPLRADIDTAIAKVLDSVRFIGGVEVTSLESEIAEVCQVDHCIGVSSGTDALLVSLMALNVGPGDEVVTTPFSFFATAGVVARLGATPVFADIEPDSFNMDPMAAAAACTDKTRAVMPVHLYGRRAPMPDVGDVPVLEDAAQAIGTGTTEGIAAGLSFFPTKNLGAFGDGGAVLSNDQEFADRVRLMRNHGARPKYYHAMVGGNFRLDSLQAAILRVKLPHLKGWSEQRRRNADRYRALFADASLPTELILPDDTPEHIYNQFVIRAPKRDELRQHLRDANIGSEIYYPRPFHLQECFANLGYEPGAFPHAEKAADEVLALPIYPALTEQQQAYVVDTIADFY